ncbi:MAG: hypothetical protein ABI083_09120 [Lapillicoccus sp.]
MHSAPDALMARTVALRLADTAGQALPKAAEALLEATYGISHPDALATLLPTICATYRALQGTAHEHTRVDPLVRRQIRHSLALDGRDLTTGVDVTWDPDPINHQGHHAAMIRQR